MPVSKPVSRLQSMIYAGILSQMCDINCCYMRNSWILTAKCSKREKSQQSMVNAKICGRRQNSRLPVNSMIFV